MSIKETINIKMIESLKAGNKEAKSVYSQALDAIKKQEINKRIVLTDDQTVDVLRKEIKQYEETKEFALKDNRVDTVSQCNYAITILSEFIPKMMEREEIIQWIADNVHEDKVKSNKGKIMKICSQLKGKADMKIVNEIIDNILS